MVEILQVPDNKVGLVIGRSGTTIRNLMQVSGATIDIPKGLRVELCAWSYVTAENKTGRPYREIEVVYFASCLLTLCS